MKLIDLLVKELPKRGGWPERAKYAWQDWDKQVRPESHGLGFYANELADNHRRRGDANPEPGDDNCVTRSQYESAIAKNDGWIEWCGGDCPVKSDGIVDVIFRSGAKEKAMPARYWHWDRGGSHSDIIAYRLHRDINFHANDCRMEQDLNECIGKDVDPAWNGEGLPPVGTICEAKVPRPITGWEWREVKVVESGIPGAEKEALVYDLETTSPSWADEFRPLRNEAEKARDDGIAEMLKAIYGPQEYTYREICELMYDAGYRKENK